MAARKRWGFSAVEWESARNELYTMLMEAAAQRSTVTYGEVANRALSGRVSPRSVALMELLGEVDRETQTRLGFTLASLVVRSDTGMPGDGYFVFSAQELGKMIDDRAAFWSSEVERVWAEYASERPQ
jgi:hypothetical protein